MLLTYFILLNDCVGNVVVSLSLLHVLFMGKPPLICLEIQTLIAVLYYKANTAICDKLY